MRRSKENSILEVCYVNRRGYRTDGEGNIRIDFVADGTSYDNYCCFTYDTLSQIFKYSSFGGIWGSSEQIAFFKNHVLQLELYVYRGQRDHRIEIFNQNKLFYKSSDTSSINFLANPIDNKIVAIVANKGTLIKIDKYQIVKSSNKRHLLLIETDSLNKFYPYHTTYYVALDNSQMKNISRNKNKYLIEIYKTKLGPIDYCNFKNYYRAIDLIKEPNNISKIDTIIFDNQTSVYNRLLTKTKHVSIKYNSLGFVKDTSPKSTNRILKEGKVSCEDYNFLAKGWKMSQAEVEKMYADTFCDSFILFLNRIIQ